MMKIMTRWDEFIILFCCMLYFVYLWCWIHTDELQRDADKALRYFDSCYHRRDDAARCFHYFYFQRYLENMRDLASRTMYTFALVPIYLGLVTFVFQAREARGIEEAVVALASPIVAGPQITFLIVALSGYYWVRWQLKSYDKWVNGHA